MKKVIQYDEMKRVVKRNSPKTSEVFVTPYGVRFITRKCVFWVRLTKFERNNIIALCEQLNYVIQEEFL